MKTLPSVIVVGAGVFGLTAALELRRRGHPVSVFDPGPLPHPDAATTDISKVIRMDYGAEDFYTDWMETAFPGWESWNATWPRPLYHQTGMLFLSSRELAPGGFEYESFVRLQGRGVQVQRLDDPAIFGRGGSAGWGDSPWLQMHSSGRAPGPIGATRHYVDGYFNPRAGWAESGAVAAELARQAAAAGVQLRVGLAFRGLLERGGRVTGIAAGGAAGSGRGGSQTHPFLADYVIVAAGAWTPVLLPWLAPVMQPVGQPVFHFRPPDPHSYRPPGFPVWAADVHTAGWYGFPATEDGIVKIANHGPGWRQDPRSPRTIPPAEEGRFRDFLRSALPGLADAPLAGQRLCFYCDTFDGDFWIAPDPQREGLVVCAGDSGHAFKFAPVLGPLIADVLEGKPNRFAARFAWRSPGPAGAEAGPTPRK